MLSDDIRAMAKEARPDWTDEELRQFTFFPEWADRVQQLEQQVERLEKVANEAERIATEAHLAADNYAYDLMRIVLRPLVGNMEMSVAQALAQQEEA